MSGPGWNGTRRVLVTGSRDWTNAATIRDALAAQWGDGSAVLVTGACPTGADRIAELFWTRWGGRVERHPADWARHGRAAGPRRNTAMVQRGADVCLAFLRNHSRGAAHTARLAEAAGIPTHRHQPGPADRRGRDQQHEEPLMDRMDRPDPTSADTREARLSVMIPDDAVRGCDHGDCRGVLAPDPGQTPICDEADGTATVSLRCQDCGLEAAHSWVPTEAQYRAQFGHPPADRAAADQRDAATATGDDADTAGTAQQPESGDSITVDGTPVMVEPVTLLRTDCAGPSSRPGHLAEGSWVYCPPCHTSHEVTDPVHTWVTTDPHTRPPATSAGVGHELTAQQPRLLWDPAAYADAIERGLGRGVGRYTGAAAADADQTDDTAEAAETGAGAQQHPGGGSAAHHDQSPSPAELVEVLAHLRGRARSHPDAPATGLHTMSDHRWRACMQELRAAGHPISESTAAGGDRASNDTGYTLRRDAGAAERSSPPAHGEDPDEDPDEDEDADEVDGGAQALSRADDTLARLHAQRRTQDEAGTAADRDGELARWHLADQAAGEQAAQRQAPDHGW